MKAAAREAGERAKVAVASTKRDVDPIGACVGLRGTRIQVISRELRGEKIDIVEWSPDPATFVARALSPAKVSSVTVAERRRTPRASSASVLVIVPDNQLSLAIGKKGQNARLAAKLTGMRVDIKSEGEVEEERRRDEEERAEGRQRLGDCPGSAPQVVGALVAAGLHSPRAIVRAGALTALQALPGIGEAKAERDPGRGPGVGGRASGAVAAERRAGAARRAAVEPTVESGEIEPTARERAEA